MPATSAMLIVAAPRPLENCCSFPCQVQLLLSPLALKSLRSACTLTPQQETRPQPQRQSELPPRDGHGGGHPCQNHTPLDEIMRLVAGMRGGELKPNRDVSGSLDHDAAVKGGGTQANAPEVRCSVLCCCNRFAYIIARDRRGCCS